MRLRVEYRRGDALEVFADLPDGLCAATVTDPPYGMAFQSNRSKHSLARLAIKNDAEFVPEFHVAWAREAYRLTKDGGALYAFIDDQHLGDMRAAIAEAGWHLKRTIVWDKQQGSTGDLEGDYSHATEFCVFAHKGRHLLRGSRDLNLLSFAKVAPAVAMHTTEKPVQLLRYLIGKSTEKGDVVLDPFAGVASCGVAAIGIDRSYIGAEIDSRWWNTADWRLSEEVARPVQTGLFGEAA